jgi:hypothetical protein
MHHELIKKMSEYIASGIFFSHKEECTLVVCGIMDRGCYVK